MESCISVAKAYVEMLNFTSSQRMQVKRRIRFYFHSSYEQKLEQVTTSNAEDDVRNENSQMLLMEM